MSEAMMPVRVMRYGVDEALPQRRELRAGPLTAILEGGDLRYIRVAGQEVVRRLYVGVRNQHWKTISPRYTRLDVAADGRDFLVEFTAKHDDEDVAFTWDGTIRGSSAGVITYTMDGVAGRSFLKNRIGFCVLHPMDLAGTPVEVVTPEGTLRSAFPERISPHQPFLDIREISYPVGGEVDAAVTIRFEGDLFETEDQRNWTDASYKTYSTPLRLPIPVRVEAGERIRQGVTLSVAASVPLHLEDDAAAGPDVVVGGEAVETLPAIGFGAASHRQPLTQAGVAALRVLRPSHLRMSLDLGDEGWVDTLTRATREARALETGLEIAAVADEDGGDGLPRLARALGEVRVPVTRVLVFPRQNLTTTPEVMIRAKAAFAAAGLDVPLGGGARTYFTEFNRASGAMPLAEMAVAGYPINPQVHAFDNTSLVETLATQAETVRSAQAIAGEVPLAIGPVTLAPPFNPNATGLAPETGSDELSPSVDPRQLSLFGAGWTVGSLRYLAEAGAASLTYYETTGWRGLMERAGDLTRRERFPSLPGGLFPLYHVFAATAEFAGGELLPVTLADRLATEALALRQGDRIRLLIANFVDEERDVTVALPPLVATTIRYLDETTYAAAAGDPELFQGSGGTAIDARDATVAVTLRPFALACLNGRIAG